MSSLAYAIDKNWKFSSIPLYFDLRSFAVSVSHFLSSNGAVIPLKPRHEAIRTSFPYFLRFQIDLLHSTATTKNTPIELCLPGKDRNVLSIFHIYFLCSTLSIIPPSTLLFILPSFGAHKNGTELGTNGVAWRFSFNVALEALNVL